MSQEKLSYFVLRAGLSFAFIYAAVRAWFDPDSWLGYFPPFLQSTLPDNVLLGLWGITEIVLAFWILSGKKIFIPSLLGGLSLLGVVAFNLNQIDVLFRDISLALVSLTLAISTYKK